ncbi:hypothetical protein C8R47DRAFT_1314508, partial [Mycena vitilis]
MVGASQPRSVWLAMGWNTAQVQPSRRRIVMDWDWSSVDLPTRSIWLWNTQTIFNEPDYGLVLRRSCPQGQDYHLRLLAALSSIFQVWVCTQNYHPQPEVLDCPCLQTNRPPRAQYQRQLNHKLNPTRVPFPSFLPL